MPVSAGAAREGTRAARPTPHPPSSVALPATPPRNCTGKQLGYQWASAGNSTDSRLEIPKLSGYDACCEACTDDYACKRFMGGKRGCTLLYDDANVILVAGPRKLYVCVMQPAV